MSGGLDSDRGPHIRAVFISRDTQSSAHPWDLAQDQFKLRPSGRGRKYRTIVLKSFRSCLREEEGVLPRAQDPTLSRPCRRGGTRSPVGELGGAVQTPMICVMRVASVSIADLVVGQHRQIVKSDEVVLSLERDRRNAAFPDGVQLARTP